MYTDTLTRGLPCRRGGCFIAQGESMANLAKILKEELKRVAARAVRGSVASLSQDVRALKRVVAYQRRLVGGMERMVRRLDSEAETRRAAARQVSDDELKSARIRPA